MTPVAGTTITFTPVGSTKAFRFFMPTGWSVSDRWSLLHVGFYGDGQNDATELTQATPLSYINSGWDGKVYLNNGNVAKFAILGIPNYTTDYASYRLAILEAVSSLGMDPVAHIQRFSSSGFSGGPPRMWKMLNAYPDTAFVFQRTVNCSAGSINGTIGATITNLTKGGFHQVWHSINDTNFGTLPSYSVGLLGYFLGSRRSITFTTENGHTGWQEVMNVRNVGTPTGGTAVTQNGGRWRWLADPFDGIGSTFTTPGNI